MSVFLKLSSIKHLRTVSGNFALSQVILYLRQNDVGNLEMVYCQDLLNFFVVVVVL